MTGMLEELQLGIDELRAANLPEYAQRLKQLEVKIKDLENRLKPVLDMLRNR